MERPDFLAGPDAGPFGKLKLEHTLQLRLCDSLEYIADGLPDSFDRRLAKSAATLLEQGLAHYVRFEDEQLFPLVRRRSEPYIAGALSQLETEHVRDQAFALEISEELERLCASAVCQNPEMLGYMLRGFFEGRRRHIAWENTVVIPVARQVLRPADLGELSAWMLAERWQDASERWQSALSNVGQYAGIATVKL